MGSLVSKAVFKSGSETLSKDIPKSFFDFKMKDISGDVVAFEKFRGKKVIMVVNVACK